MTLLLDQRSIGQFSRLITGRIGLHFDETKFDFLGDVLRARMEAKKCVAFDEYAHLLGSNKGREEFRALAEQLTVGETFFFRNADNFRAFTELQLPDRLRANAATKRLRILSAGCSSGDEAHSIAILLRETVPDIAGWDVRITGIDLNPAILAKASAGKYSEWSLRVTPDETRRKYFQQDGRGFVLNSDIRKMVSFQERNLTEPDATFWHAHSYDVIFCRNVLMYFTTEIMQQVVRRLHTALVPGGYLFLGHAETLRGISQDFHLCHTHGTFYYQRREDGERHRDSDTFERRLNAPNSTDSTGRIELDPTMPWADAIQQASARIASLGRGGSASPDAWGTEANAPQPVWNFDGVLDAMRNERFVDALALLLALPSVAHGEPDAMLMRAALLVNCGRIHDAEETCRALITLDELNAGAYYLMALCREHSGDVGAAIEHDRYAIYLDPDFAMPHLHLGLISTRVGDREEAERELARALDLLAREDSSRLLLFGGGFSRKTLLQVCSAGLRSASSRT